MHNSEDLWGLEESAEASTAPSYFPSPRYSADYLQQSPTAAPPIVSVGFGADGEPAYILRSQGGRELTRVAATKENSADERPRGFFAGLARLMHGSRR